MTDAIPESVSKSDDLLVAPDPHDPRLTEQVTGTDQEGNPVDTSVTVERPLALFLNSREIVTLMTIGDYPECLAVGYLLNQNMLRPGRCNHRCRLRRRGRGRGCAHRT